MIALATCKQYPDLVDEERQLIGLLKARGVEAHAAVWNSPSVDWSKFKTVVLRSTWDYYTHYGDFIQWLVKLEMYGVHVFNSVQTIRWNLNKKYLKEFESSGIAILPTRWLREGSDLEREVQAAGWKDCILKPSVSADGHATIRFAAVDASSFQGFLEAHSKNSVMMLQPYMSGIEQGEKSYLFFDRKFSHAVLKYPRSGEFRVQSSHGGTKELFKPVHSDLAFSERILKLVPGRLLYARVDMIQDSGNTYLCELELVEPCLYFAQKPGSAEVFVDALVRYLV